jgi:hypothetical protein
MMDADALLNGPRGRRAAFVCLGDDRGLPDVLSDSLWDLTRELDPRGGGVGYSRIVAGPSFGGIERSEPEPERLSRDEIGAALLELPIDANRIDPLEALDAAVESAAYWQEPDGDDALCALPGMRPALRRAAHVLLSRPETEWWDAPIDLSDQWAVDFDFGHPHPRGLMRPDVHRFRSEATAEEAQARLETPSDPSANFSGTWWSTPLLFRATLTTTRALGTAGPVGLRLVEDSMGPESARASRVGVAPSARIYEIRHADDWAELCRRFPLHVTASRRHDWYRATGRVGEWVIPDWTSVSEHYDGVHLSAAAYLQTAGAVVPVDDEWASLIAGWDPDATYWFRPDVLEIHDDEPTGWEHVERSEWRSK